MASKTAILAVRVVTDAQAGQKGLADTERQVKSLGDAAGRLTVPAAAMAGAVALIYKSAGDAASALQQSVGAVQSVFQEYSGTINQAAKDAALSVGLSASEYGNLATVIGSQLKNMGLPLDEAAGKTQDLIGLGADLAATFGGSTADAVEALSALLRGERDPIERYGVSINQAAVNSKLAEMGLSGLTGEAAKNATLQATLALLTQQTADATGQFGREANTAEGAQQRANAQWENAKAALGQGFLPVMVLAADAASKLAGLVNDNAGAASALVLGLGGLSGGILAFVGVMKVWQAAQEALTIAQGIGNAVMAANPIGILIVLIALLVAEIVVIALHWDQFAAAAENAWDRVKRPIQPIIDAVSQLFGWIRKVAGAFAGIDGFAGYQAPDAQVTAQSRMATPALTTARVFARAAVVEPEGVTSAPVRRATPAADAQAGDTINLYVSGAIDPDSTARKIQTALASRENRNGSALVGATRSIR